MKTITRDVSRHVSTLERNEVWRYNKDSAALPI